MSDVYILFMWINSLISLIFLCLYLFVTIYAYRNNNEIGDKLKGFCFAFSRRPGTLDTKVCVHFLYIFPALFGAVIFSFCSYVSILIILISLILIKMYTTLEKFINKEFNKDNKSEEI